MANLWVEIYQTEYKFRILLAESRAPKISVLSMFKGGGGGVQAYQFGKKDFELGVGGEGQDTSRDFDGSFGSIRAILPM